MYSIGGGVRAVKTILLIEQYETLRALYEEVFQDAGYRVTTARSFDDALTMVTSSSPDVVVCDLWTDCPSEAEGANKLFDAVSCPTIVNSGYLDSMSDDSRRIDDGRVTRLMKSSDYCPLLDEIHRATAVTQLPR